MQSLESVVLYDLIVDDNLEIVDEGDRGFDAESYSRMKHGIVTDIHMFAGQLAAKLIIEAPQLVLDDEPPALVVAYETLPHAATILTGYCLETINHYRLNANLKPGHLLRIFTSDYLEPYSSYAIADRQQLIARQHGTINEQLLDNSRPIVVDDIYVTGTQTQWFRDVLAQYTDAPILGCYVARLAESVAGQHPEIESRLDDAHIRELRDLLFYIQNDDFVFIHKFLRDVLTANPAELEKFLNHLPDKLMYDLAQAVDVTNAGGNHQLAANIVYENAAHRPESVFAK